MSSAKDTFEANTWEANSFAAGAFRGVGVDVVINTDASILFKGQKIGPLFKGVEKVGPLHKPQKVGPLFKDLS